LHKKKERKKRTIALLSERGRRMDCDSSRQKDKMLYFKPQHIYIRIRVQQEHLSAAMTVWTSKIQNLRKQLQF